MGCKGSKLDEQEAVALCRGRADLLAVAVRHRYALADAHAALADSLMSVSSSLHLLLVSAPPRLTLPAERKDVSPPPTRSSSPPHCSSHIDFPPSSASESGSVASSPPRCVVGHQEQLHRQHPHAVPLPHYGYGYGYGYGPEPPFGYPPGSLQLYYAQSRPPAPSVTVEQRAASAERVYFGSFEPGVGNRHRQYSSYGGEPTAAGRAAALPPSPPRTSSWDFFNVFDDYEVYDNYCYDAGGAGTAAATSYTPSRSSREVREEEGIPELEDDDVAIKEVSSK